MWGDVRQRDHLLAKTCKYKLIRNETNVPKCRRLGDVRIIAFRAESLVGLEGFLEEVGLCWTLKCG